MINDKTTECLLCGSPATLKKTEYPGYQEPLIFNIYHCSVCDTAFSMPRGSFEKVYEDIYKNGDLLPGYDRYWGYSMIVKNLENPLEYLANAEEAYWGVKEALILLVNDKKNMKILEIGSGLGYLTYSLNKDNYNVRGIDISQTAVNMAISNFGNYFQCEDLFVYVQNHLEEYNIVILTEVIEHINNPKEFIKAIYMLLKPKGRIIITTPNKSLYPKELLWATELPPIHCWWFSEESMKFFAKSINSNISFINYNNYYKKNYHFVDIKSIYPGTNPQPVLNMEGNILKTTNLRMIAQSTILQSLLSKIPYLKKIFRIIRKLLKPHIIICKERGIVLCAIIEK